MLLRCFCVSTTSVINLVPDPPCSALRREARRLRAADHRHLVFGAIREIFSIGPFLRQQQPDDFGQAIGHYRDGNLFIFASGAGSYLRDRRASPSSSTPPSLPSLGFCSQPKLAQPRLRGAQVPTIAGDGSDGLTF
jgi:hypothetical protein